MLLRALRDMPTVVNLITRGQVFHAINEEQAREWIRGGYAEEVKSEELNRPTAASMLAVNAFPNWPGATVVIVASGESLTTEHCAAVREWKERTAGGLARVIAINTSYRRAPFADVLYACDGAWWRAKDPELLIPNVDVVRARFQPEQLWTQDAAAAKEYGLRFIASQRNPGLSKRAGLINQGMNSAYQAMNFSFLAGARRMVLLGVDCKGGHWHGDHPKPLSNRLPHRQWKEHFARLAHDLRNEGVDVANCSPGTALQAFRLADLHEELAR